MYASRFDLITTNNGYMVYDIDCDEYLSDNFNNNLFENINDANKLIEDFVYTLTELERG
jgi:hypothetical protein